MAQRRVGMWLIGACGGVGSTTALGIAALARGLTPTTGLVTALPRFAGLDLDAPAAFVVGGHDIREASLTSAVAELHERSRVLDERVIAACAPDLEAWSANLRLQELTPARASLEDVFIDLTRNAVEYHGVTDSRSNAYELEDVR